jgi:CopG family transcriptional regulator, nickel-responsive regulator
MAKITSFSLDENDLDNLNRLQKELTFKGRSETIRAAIALLDMESKDISKLKGIVSAVLIIKHNHSKNIDNISHHWKGSIKTHIHNHYRNKHCVDIFIVESKAESLKDINKMFIKDKRIIITKLIIL